MPQGIHLSHSLSSLDFAGRTSAVVAVSGGSDSTALLCLLKDHLERHAAHIRLVAVTVDHALRAGSAEEAADVARFCARLGVIHRIETWTGPKPQTGVLAAAREARHALLAAAARTEGTDLVLTGHTANDQAETILMRAARNRDRATEGRGLAGIAPATLFEGDVWFARPLLSTSRQALRYFLTARGIGWIDDPSNTNERYERPRLRGSLGEADIARALSMASDATLARVALGKAAAKLIDENGSLASPGLLRLEPAFFEGDASLYALRILLAVTGGTEQLPDEDRARALQARLKAEASVRAVLSRTLVDQRRDAIFLLREQRDLPDVTDTRLGGIWDGRYRLLRASEAEAAASRQPIENNESRVPESLIRLAATAQPDFPPERKAVPVVAPWARYLPSFDIAPARAAAKLVGAPGVPDAPFPRHIESEP